MDNIAHRLSHKHVGLLCHAKFHLSQYMGVGTQLPKYQKFPLLVKIHPAGANPLTDIYKFQGLLCAQRPCTSFSNLSWFASQVMELCRETMHQSFTPNFSVHSVRITMRWIETWLPPFIMGTTSSITLQSLGEVELCVPAVGAKMWCLFFVHFFFCHAPRPAHHSFEGDIVWASIVFFCVTVYRPIVTLFSTFSSEWIALSDALEVDQIRRDLKTHLFEWHCVSFSALAVFSHNALYKSTFYLLTYFDNFHRQTAPQFSQIVVKNCEKSKNWQKSLCAQLCLDSWEISVKFHCSSLRPRM